MTELFSVASRLAFVTGSSRGLGRSLARSLARGGARLIVHGRDAAATAEARDEMSALSGLPAYMVTFDVTDADAVAATLHEMVDRFGLPDILVNNAGVQHRAPFHEFPVAEWDRVIAANLSGPFYVARALAPGFVARGSGKIVNVGSVQSVLARRTITPYSASKGGLAQLTRGMAADLAPHGIQVNTLSPGYFATEMNRALVEDAAFSSWLEARTPAGRWGELAELEGALIFLCSDASSFVSGQNLVVDGGMTSVV